MRISTYKPTGQNNKITPKYIIKRLIQLVYIPFQLIFQSIIACLPTKKRNVKYEVSFCLIFKDEAKYLQEWIEYHKLIGVDHFYLYNNFSTDNYMEVLETYIANGDVTLIDWPHKYAQIEAYQDAYNKFGNETKWLGYIDADEFINLRKHNSIKELLHIFRKYPGVYFHWRMFGSSGFIEPPKDYRVIPNYTSCWLNLCNTGKTFINTDYTLRPINSPHYMISKKWGIPLFPCSLNKIPCVLFQTIYTKRIAYRGYINHYWSKSYREYYIKDFLKGDVANESNIAVKKSTGRFEYHELKNSSKDFSIQRWQLLLSTRLDNSGNIKQL